MMKFQKIIEVNKNIIFVMDGLDFYKYREMFILHLKEKRAPK